MPSDKHKSRMVRARDLISSLINVTSSRDVPFHHRSSYSVSLHHGATFEPLCAPILSSQPCTGDDSQLARNGFSARHKYCSDTFHSYNVKRVGNYCWNRGVMAFMHCDMGCALHTCEDLSETSDIVKAIQHSQMYRKSLFRHVMVAHNFICFTTFIAWYFLTF